MTTKATTATTVSANASCDDDIAPLTLVREGTHQEQRLLSSLDPTYAPVDDRTVAHGMMFARAYSEFLKFHDAANVPAGNWSAFFSEDVSVQLATASLEDIDRYQAVLQERFKFLNDISHKADNDGLIVNLSYVFGYAATLALQFDRLRESLPDDIELKGTLANLIQTRLAPAFKRLIGYYKGDAALAPATRVILDTLPPPNPTLLLLGEVTVAFEKVFSKGLSDLWITDGSPDWVTYRNAIAPDATVYGVPAGTVYERINHIATHNLFTGIFDQFLKVYARLAQESRTELERTLTGYAAHQPHYALFLAFLQLFEHARATTNTLTGRHLDFYYRDVLKLRERGSSPGHAHLITELARHISSHEIRAGELFRAGKDALGKNALFASDRAFVANQGAVTSLKKVYRNGSEVYAAPIANSDNGLTSELAAPDKSWQPFYNKTFKDGALFSIDMPRATMGFAVASHYLLLREGVRTITLHCTMSGFGGAVNQEHRAGVTCRFSGEKGWFEAAPSRFKAVSATSLELQVIITGDQPAVVPYSDKVHGYGFATMSPVMLVSLVNTSGQTPLYNALENVVVSAVRLEVDVDRVRDLLLSNDFGPIDASKPFLPFGAQPETGSSVLIGSQELFSKRGLTRCDLHLEWKNIQSDIKSVAYRVLEEDFLTNAAADAYTTLVPDANVYALIDGQWQVQRTTRLFDGDAAVTIDIEPALAAFNKSDAPDFVVDAAFTAATKTGFVRLELRGSMGHVAYREAIANYLVAAAKGPAPKKPTAPYTPEVASVYASYTASQTISLASASPSAFTSRSGRFFHFTDFGQAEQHPVLKVGVSNVRVYLLPQMRHANVLDAALPLDKQILHEGELFIGVVGLTPPQNLALLFQLSDGTANPLSAKPHPHIHWSYLQNNEWIAFAKADVEDPTAELLKSGIVRLAMPKDATAQNTLLPAGLHWLRLAVAEKTDAVDSIIAVIAQALDATFADRENDPAFSAVPLAPGTIVKLAQPDSSIKKISQPFATFGGTGTEPSRSFYTRASERLRHKDRAITLWDIEHLVLEAFPQIHRVKCLNHTRFEPTASGGGIYRERAPGHITVVTIPDQRTHNLANPLKPYTSLSTLEAVASYLQKRATCFATVHVRNPKFEEVRVRFNVRLHTGYDESFYQAKLQQAITMFLSPWAFAGYGNPSFGGKIFQSVLINFVEEQPYVDYLTDFKLFHDVDGVHGTVNLLEVVGSTAVSVLVSAPASNHEITVVSRTTDETVREQCGCAE